jgi:hypothetical protein
LLAKLAAAASDDDRKAVTRIAKRTLARGTPNIIFDRSSSLGRALRALPESWTLNLLRLQSGAVVEPPWDPVWDERKLILSALHSANGSPMPEVARSILASLPTDEELASGIAESAADLSVEDGQRYYRKRLAEGRKEALEVLARLGDSATIRSFAEISVRSATPTSTFPLPLTKAIVRG